MPKDTPTKRFVMDTATFISIWRNHINHDAAKDETAWRRFVINIFDRFTGTNEIKNRQLMLEVDAKWAKWDDDAKYAYLSEKAYSKCITIKRKLKKEQNFDVGLPNGYLSRNGTKASKRLDSSAMAALFTTGSI